MYLYNFIEKDYLVHGEGYPFLRYNPLLSPAYGSWIFLKYTELKYGIKAILNITAGMKDYIPYDWFFEMTPFVKKGLNISGEELGLFFHGFALSILSLSEPDMESVYPDADLYPKPKILPVKYFSDGSIVLEYPVYFKNSAFNIHFFSPATKAVAYKTITSPPGSFVSMAIKENGKWKIVHIDKMSFFSDYSYTNNPVYLIFSHVDPKYTYPNENAFYKVCLYSAMNLDYAVILLQVMTAMPVSIPFFIDSYGDNSEYFRIMPDVDGDEKYGLPEVLYILKKVSEQN